MRQERRKDRRQPRILRGYHTSNIYTVERKEKTKRSKNAAKDALPA